MESGTLLGHYRVIAKLGEGGMGAVYAAEDTKLGRQVALKLLPERVAEDPERRRRFEREARAVAAITHPNVVVLYAFEEADGAHFLTMEHVEGNTLDEIVPVDGLPLERFLELALPLVGAVDAANESGVIHRDLKPTNIMVTTEGSVKVLDFGLAKLSDIAREGDPSALGTALPTQYATETGHIFGTPSYMSPEQLRGDPVDHRSDIFSLGIVLYQMASGTNPFLRKNLGDTLAAILKEEPAPLTHTEAGLPPSLRAVLQRMLSKEPDARPQASEVGEELEKCRSLLSGPITAAGHVSALVQTARRPYVAVPLLLAAALVGYFAYQAIDRASQIRWARQVALPELDQMVQGRSGRRGQSQLMWDAHELASQVAEVIPDDPVLATLWPQVARAMSLTSDPPGARVYARPYPAIDADWTYLGTTPFELRVARGIHRWKIEKDEYRTRELMLDTHPFSVLTVLDEAFLDPPDTASFSLMEVGSLPDEMVRVPGSPGGRPIWVFGIEELSEPFAEFAMDRFEVTNREYKDFVDAGGYTTDEHWHHPFLDEDGLGISWQEAMDRFVDKTGLTGPFTWEVGDYPEGEDDYPVAGVSWYEAAAYAAFVDKRLPTLFHWAHAASPVSSAEAVPLSNFDGDGPVAVGSRAAMNMWGTYDLGGNVREWVLNDTSDPEERFILGGGWNDPGYAFMDSYSQAAMDRSITNGIRLARYAESEEHLASLARPLEKPSRDFLAEVPASDETFETYLGQFDYDRIDLDVLPAGVPHEGDDWLYERVSFTAAYGGERMVAHVLLPKGVEPPFQAVIAFPGIEALNRFSSEDWVLRDHFQFFAKRGRAVILPVYKGTWERKDEWTCCAYETNAYRDHVIMWVNDVSRTIDYLEARDDIDTEKLAYFGYSWGGGMGAIVPAVESRLQASVLYVAGLDFVRVRPEVDPINFIGRVTLPVLMVNGQNDGIFPVGTSQQPFFDLLGTPEQDKRWVVYPGLHSAPLNDLIREALSWLDKHLGPVGQ